MPRGIFEAYLSGDAGAFFNGHFSDAQDRRGAVLRAVRPLEPALAGALEGQNAGLTPSRLRDHHLAALRRGAAAVVTGQQVGLFLGPLYTIYKAASVIRLAEILAAESGRPVVPVFWLQTEDHDLPEIAECHAPCAHGDPLTMRVPASPDDRISIAHRPLPDAVTSCAQQLRAALATLPHAEAHLARVEHFYVPGAPWAGAFAGLLAELFAPEGLVVVDPRDPALAAAARPLHRRALTSAASIAHALTAHAQTLARAGFAAAVHVRPGAPLSFFHPEGPAGPRYRLAPAPHGFVEVGGQGAHTLDALLAALDAEPLRFSTSALLRPILQDTVLPTAAYVAGPGEVAYLAQTAPLYAAYGMAPPVVVPRVRLRILEEKTARVLRRWGIGAADVHRSEDELLAMVAEGAAGAPDRAALDDILLTPLTEALGAIRVRLEGAGLEAHRAVERTRATVETAVARLAERITRAARHHDQGVVDDVRRVRMSLHPHGVPQERYYGLSYFAARYGARAFVERVLAEADPLESAPRDLVCVDQDAAPVPRADA